MRFAFFHPDAVEWSAPECPLRIKYWPEMLEILSGVECAGVLYGVQTGQTVVLEDFRPIDNSNDEKELRQLLALPLREPSLYGLTPLGWYRVGAAGDLKLTAQDVEFCTRYFPLAFQVVLLLRTEKGGAAAGAFYVRRPDGSVTPEPGEGQIRLTPTKLPARLAAVVPALPQPAPARPSERKLLMAALIAVFLLAVVILPPWRGPGAWNEPVKLGLTVSNEGDTLRITWSPDRQTMETARGGLLRIEEGGEDTDAVMLDKPGPPGGSVSYRPRSSFVLVHLKIYRHGTEPVEESVFCLARMARNGRAVFSAVPAPERP